MIIGHYSFIYCYSTNDITAKHPIIIEPICITSIITYLYPNYDSQNDIKGVNQFDKSYHQNFYRHTAYSLRKHYASYLRHSNSNQTKEY